jgi:hypothetical protein
MTAITPTAWLLASVATIVFATITLCLLSMGRWADAERTESGPTRQVDPPTACRRPAGTGGRSPVRSPSVRSRSTRIPVKR